MNEYLDSIIKRDPAAKSKISILLTYPGERVGNLEFGCRLREVCFEQQDENLPEKIQTTIADAVTKFLPYINILDIATQSNIDQSEKVYVTIKFSTTLDPLINQSLTLDTTEATEVDSVGANDSGRPSGGY